jgi:hypothetical protein
MADPSTPFRKLMAMPGVRPAGGDALTIMQKRLPKLPKSQAVDFFTPPGFA